jgi:site-specific DNA-methyltransferase (adenine-specific)
MIGLTPYNCQDTEYAKITIVNIPKLKFVKPIEVCEFDTLTLKIDTQYLNGGTFNWLPITTFGPTMNRKYVPTNTDTSLGYVDVRVDWSVAKNVLKWNTGGINIDGCRIGEELITTNGYGTNGFVASENYKPSSHIGRFPANIICDEKAGEILDEQSGVTKSSNNKWVGEDTSPIYGKYNFRIRDKTYDDKGGASRFFYCPKPSKKERNEGMPIEIGEFSQRPRRENGTVIYKETHLEEWTQVMSKLKRKDKTSKAAAEEKLQENSNGLKNNHPTIKPIKLMQYLIRLVTPKGGITVDPYFGSGSSGKSTIREDNDYKFIGIEKEKEYFNIAVERCQYEYSKSLKQAA